MLYVQPGATFAAIIEGFSAGLAGTLGVRVENSDGTTHTARTTAGIVEVEALSGVYAKSDLVAPSTAGVYVLLWDAGSTFKSERFEVTSTGAVAATPSGSDLTTVAAVREALQKDAGDTDQDIVIQREITRCSAVLKTYAQREFAPVSAGVARTFSYTGGALYLGSYDLRSVTTMELDTDTATSLTLAVTDYMLRPLTPREGVYTWVLLPHHSASELAPREVTITGDWGFPTVPADVEEACVLTVVERIRRDVSAFSQAFPDDEGASPQRPIGIPFAARSILDSYRRPLIA